MFVFRRKGRRQSHPPMQWIERCMTQCAQGRMDRLSVVGTSLDVETPSRLVIVSTRKMPDAYFLPVSSATNYARQCRWAVSCG